MASSLVLEIRRVPTENSLEDHEMPTSALVGKN